MKKILPVFILVSSIAIAILSATAFICVISALFAEPAKIVAVPTAILSFVLSALTAPFAILFKRDGLCFVSIFVSGGALLLSAAAIAVWLIAL